MRTVFGALYFHLVQYKLFAYSPAYPLIKKKIITNCQKFIYGSFLLSLTITACAPAAKPTPPRASIIVQLAWTHQAQFAGFYAAEQNGYYAEEGLAVTFLEGGPGVNTLQPVLDGTAQFSLSNPDSVLLARAEGQKIRTLAAVLRRSPRVYVALAKSGITRPQDFVGKTIAVNKYSRPMLLAIMQRIGIPQNQYTVVDTTPDLAQLTSGEVDVRSVFLTNEVLTLQAAGYDVNIIYPDDYGIHTYADTIIATDQTIVANPNLALRFLRATLKGWTWAIENSKEAAALVQKYNPKADIQMEYQKMVASSPLINTGEDFIGWMKPEIWVGLEKFLRDQGVLSTPVDVSQAYTMQFLEEIYKGK